MPVPESAVVHPLVLLSVVDHYNRVARDTKKRVVGVLLGEHSKERVDITNSFAGEKGRAVIPFSNPECAPCFVHQRLLQRDKPSFFELEECWNNSRLVVSV